jgi:hypothetical protein
LTLPNLPPLLPLKSLEELGLLLAQGLAAPRHYERPPAHGGASSSGGGADGAGKRGPSAAARRRAWAEDGGSGSSSGSEEEGGHLPAARERRRQQRGGGARGRGRHQAAAGAADRAAAWPHPWRACYRCARRSLRPYTPPPRCSALAPPRPCRPAAAAHFALSPDPPFRPHPRGGCNVETVKDVSFVGLEQPEEMVAAGSDGGLLLLWERATGARRAGARGAPLRPSRAAEAPATRPPCHRRCHALAFPGRLVSAVRADRHVVNGVAPHPTLPCHIARCGLACAEGRHEWAPRGALRLGPITPAAPLATPLLPHPPAAASTAASR